MSKPSVRPPVFAELTQRPAPPPRQPARAAEPLEAVREGHRIAHAIIARAEAQAREILATAREQGFEAGRREALEQVSDELHGAATALAAAAAKLEDTRVRLARELATSLPATAVQIAARVLRRELSVRPEMLAQVVRDAVAAVTPASRVEVRVHPEDLATLERYRAVVAEVLGGAELRLEASPSVERGGCFVETEALTLAGGIPERLERALDALGGGQA